MSSELLEKDVVNVPDISGGNASGKDMISVIASVVDFEEGIQELYQSLSETMKESGKNYELIFVDDASKDKTYEILLKIEKEDPLVKIIRMRAVFGEAASYDAGLKNSKGDIVILLTGRVRIAASGLLELLQTLEDGHDMVVGWRYPRADSALNQVVSKSFNWLVRKISNIQLHDMNSGVLVARREALENIEIYGALNSFLPVLAVRKGYKVTERKIEQLKGWFRRSVYFKEYLQRLLDILTVIFLTRYSKKPIHFLGFVGTVFTLLGLGVNVYLFFYRILEIGPIGGRPLLLFGSLLLVVGVQMISIGLIGEMIIFTHARDIKEYNIEKIVE